MKRSPGTKKGAGGKIKKGTKRKDRDQELFPYFHTLSPEDLAQYEDVVFADPNRRNMLFRMHERSRPNAACILRYTSMSRRHHLNTQMNRDRPKRFIKRQANAAYQDNCRLILADKQPYDLSNGIQRGRLQGSEANTILGPLYDDILSKKNRWRSSIGNQRDKTLLRNLIRRQFGPNPVIILGDGSPPTARFHAPTKGVGLRMDLLRLG